MQDLQYPTSVFEYGKSYTLPEIQKNINTIQQFVPKLRTLVNHLTRDQLNTPYREGGWTGRQVIQMPLSDSNSL